MHIDWTNPTKMALISLGISFVLFVFALWILNPKCINKIDENGNEKVSIPLLISFSAVFALVTAIITLLVVSQKSGRIITTESAFSGYYH
jgi:hypothetical protein